MSTATETAAVLLYSFLWERLLGGSLGIPPRQIYISPSTIPERFLWGVQYPHYHIDCTTEAAAEVVDAAALDFSDLKKKFGSYFD